MTNLSPALDLSARAVLFDSDHAALAALRGVVTSGPTGDRIRAALGNLSQATATAAAQRIGVEANHLLDLDILTVLSAAWLKYTKLREAARRTLAEPTSEELVELATQSIGWEHSPQIDLLVDARRVATITLTLNYEMDVELLVVKIERGAVTEIRAGRCRGTLALAVDGQTVVRRPVNINLARAIPLTRPISLVDSHTA